MRKSLDIEALLSGDAERDDGQRDAEYVREPSNAALVEGADAAGNTGTAYSMSVGDTFSGSLVGTGPSDTDWIGINLTAGQTINIALTGTGGTPIANPYLQLFDSSGSFVDFDDDSGPGNDALLAYTASTTGTYFISPEEFSFAEGGYELSVTAGAGLPVFTLDEIAFQLTDVYWTNQGDTRAGFNATAGDTITVNTSALTAEGQELAGWALEAWTSVSGLNFQEVAGAAQITFDDEASGAFANSSLGGGFITSSTVNVSKTNWLPTYGTTIDSYSFQTYMHEIGHALGLGHAGQYNGSAVYGTDNHYLNDSWQATVMSYFDQNENTFIVADKAYTMTLMIADVIAIQDLYGTPVANNPTDTTYFENSNLTDYLGDLFGQMYAEDAADSSLYIARPTAFTLYDSGGTDLINLMSATSNTRIDLNAEAISDINGLTGNLIIARDTVIENVTTGSGDDHLTGNAAANNLQSGTGDDTLIGSGGNDTLAGGADADTYDVSGLTNDRVTISVDNTGNATVTKHVVGGTDTVTGVETFVAGEFLTDVLTLATQVAEGDVGTEIQGLGDTAVGTFTPSVGAPVAFGPSEGYQLSHILGGVSPDGILPAVGPVGSYSISSGDESGTVGNISFENFETVNFGVACFAAGTRIATPTGCCAVEDLSLGQLIRTTAGKSVPVKWIGRQTVVPVFAGLRTEPVRIRAGALGGGLPHSDLTVTADHGMILDGLVINAAALVNCSTIDFVSLSELPTHVTYYHIETQAHDVILANGAPAETFIDYVGRTAFDNYQEYVDLYGCERIIPEMDCIRISAQRLVPDAIKARLGIVEDLVSIDDLDLWTEPLRA